MRGELRLQYLQSPTAQSIINKSNMEYGARSIVIVVEFIDINNCHPTKKEAKRKYNNDYNK